jgi:endoglucanase
MRRVGWKGALALASLLVALAGCTQASGGDETEAASSAPPPGPSTAAPLSVKGNSLINASTGKPVRLLGVNRSGTEYACAQGWGFTDSPYPNDPDTPEMVAAIASWHANAVRVPLNEACWLGTNGVDPSRSGAAYQANVDTYIQRLEAAGLNPILDLHNADPGDYPARQATNGLRAMPDAAHAVPFWREVAQKYGSDRAVVFDLYNEPNDVGWGCLRDGCMIASDGYQGDIPPYQAVGMQQLVDVIRGAGAKNVIMVPGIQWTGDLSRWLEFRPRDPLRRVAASFHNYEGNLGSCHHDCWESTIARIALRFPVVTGEMGDTDCNHSYISPYMRWADERGISYLGWTWDATDQSSFTCTGGPSLITRYDGTPTGYGIGLRNHLQRLAR